MNFYQKKAISFAHPLEILERMLYTCRPERYLSMWTMLLLFDEKRYAIHKPTSKRNMSTLGLGWRSHPCIIHQNRLKAVGGWREADVSVPSFTRMCPVYPRIGRSLLTHKNWRYYYYYWINMHAKFMYIFIHIYVAITKAYRFTEICAWLSKRSEEIQKTTWKVDTKGVRKHIQSHNHTIFQIPFLLHFLKNKLDPTLFLCIWSTTPSKKKLRFERVQQEHCVRNMKCLLLDYLPLARGHACRLGRCLQWRPR